jgi:hypothetical protein
MIYTNPWALFRADFPSDMIYEGHGEPVHGGRNVAEAIGEILRRMGCTVEEPEYGGEHGWGFVFRRGRVRFWIEVSEGWDDGHTLRWEDWPPVLSTSQSHLGLMLKLNEQMKRDGRFHDIAWYRNSDVGSAENGSRSPVVGELPKAPDLSDEQPSFVDRLLTRLRSLMSGERSL